MGNQTKGVFFMVVGLIFLGFVFSQKGQAIWKLLVSPIPLPGSYGGGTSNGQGVTRSW